MKIEDKLSKIVKKVGSKAELARQLGVTRSYVGSMLVGRRTISPKIVRKLVLLSGGEVTEKDLRPDIFYGEFEEKKELSMMVA